MRVSHVRCDDCGKLVEADEDGDLPRGWRAVVMPLTLEKRDLCSPACAIRQCKEELDRDWKPEAEHPASRLRGAGS